ncbi:MAG TPA: LysR family transcriptional regulator [Solirubrobacteraceae bacterium]
MNLRQLEYFVAIADAGSVTRAAEQLFVSQPSLSQQIAALEQELGGQLLERLPRGVRLTAAGQSLLPEARAAIHHADRGRHAVRSALELEAGQIEVAATTATAAGVLPTVLRGWQERYPGIEISLLEFLHRRAMVDAVRDGVGDIAVGAHPHNWPGPVEHLGWEEFKVVLPAEDPLLELRSIRLAALAGRRWVHFAAATGLAEVLDICCASAGFSPRVAMRTSQVPAAARFAATGLGPTLMPAHTIPDGLADLARPASPPIARALAAFTREDWTPLTSAFLAALRAYPWKAKPRRALDLG